MYMYHNIIGLEIKHPQNDHSSIDGCYVNNSLYRKLINNGEQVFIVLASLLLAI